MRLAVAEPVWVAAGALPTAGIDGSGIESADEATWPSCVVPLGIAAVGAALVFSCVSFPPDPTRERSAVFVSSLVVVWACVVNTGGLRPWRDGALNL